MRKGKTAAISEHFVGNPPNSDAPPTPRHRKKNEAPRWDASRVMIKTVIRYYGKSYQQLNPKALVALSKSVCKSLTVAC
jgi:hypothetical protein